MNSYTQNLKPYIMKNFVLLFTAMILSTTGVFATGINEDKVATSNTYRYDNSFIFIENGITFSVYPDGEFDFYIENQVSGRRDGITFNSGYDYSPYAQYDDYGAVIQVENVPIYYDYYGRVNQIGDVDINYLNNRVRRVGGMNVYYNNRGFYDYHTGYINIYNRNYVYQPYHRWFARPAINLCLVYNRPYRRYYAPVRYSYYSPYRNNYRKAYVNVGKQHRYNNVRNERATVYRNDKRVDVRDNSYRNNRTVAKRDNGLKTNRTLASNNKTRINRDAVSNRSNTSQSNQGRTVTKREDTRTSRNSGTMNRANNSAARSNQSRTVTKREVTSTPRSTTVKRSITTYKKPVTRSTDTRTQRSSTASRTATKSPSRTQSTVSRSTTSRSVSKAPARSTTSRSATTRSSRRN